MILCLDVGNSQIYGGVFDKEELQLQFRKTSQNRSSSDELGLFLKSVLRENNINPDDIQKISLCSVVPDMVHSLKNSFKKYFNKNPFILMPGVRSGLKIMYRNPIEVGPDRIANCVGAIEKYPNKNLIVADFGTATTFCAISKQKEYLGGIITSGLRISMEALENNTARLPKVEILKPSSVIGRSTVEGIQSGLFYGNLGMIKEIKSQITQECFKDEKPLLIGTGGFSSLYSDTDLFDAIIPDLVLQGLYQCLKMNN